MCGIGGFSLNKDDTAVYDPPALARALAVLLQDRGTDATGFAVWDEENHDRPYYWKMGTDASDFCQLVDLPFMLNTCIVHTRHGTKGTEKDNANNHPVVAEGIALVHNGVIYNDDDIVMMLGTEKEPGEVDSRVLAHLLAFGPEVLHEDRPEKLLEMAEGWASVAWLDYHHPDDLFLARMKTSPLYVAWTEKDDLIFGSTVWHVESAAAICGVPLKEGFSLKEGTFLKVTDGVIKDSREIVLPKPVATTTTFAPFGAPEGPVGMIWQSPSTKYEYIKVGQPNDWMSLATWQKNREAAASQGWDNDEEESENKPIAELSKPADANMLWQDNDGNWHEGPDCWCDVCYENMPPQQGGTHNPGECFCADCNSRWWDQVEAEDWDTMIEEYTRKQKELALAANAGDETQ